MNNTDHSQKHFFIAAAPLFLVIFIDGMGLGLVFPILNALMFNPDAHFVSATLGSQTRDLLYGLSIGIFMFCWFFGAAFLGDLSDQIGRKKSIMICLIGGFIGYALSAAAVILQSYSLLLLGRVIAGFTAGSQSIAQAAIVDISTPEHKARNIGLILFFCSLGFIAGPIIGGVLCQSTLVSWFNYAMPFYFAAAISLLNIVLLFFLSKETFFHQHKIILKFNHAIKIFVSAFTHEKIRELSIVFLAMELGWSGMYSFISMYLLKAHQFNELQIGFYMGALGIGFGIGNGLLTEFLTQRFSLKACVIGNSIVAVSGILITIFASTEWVVWPASLLISAPIAVAYSAILTLFSNQVSADEQGWIMGITGAIMAFAFGAMGLLIGTLSNTSPGIPLLISAGFLVLTAILMKMIFKNGNG